MNLSLNQKRDVVSGLTHAIAAAMEVNNTVRISVYTNLRKTFEQAIQNDERQHDARN